jgi:hypothetical protein
VPIFRTPLTPRPFLLIILVDAIPRFLAMLQIDLSSAWIAASLYEYRVSSIEYRDYFHLSKSDAEKIVCRDQGLQGKSGR